MGVAPAAEEEPRGERYEGDACETTDDAAGDGWEEGGLGWGTGEERGGGKGKGDGRPAMEVWCVDPVGCLE